LSRINGGTNMAAPLRHAQKMFAEVAEHLGGGAARVVGRTRPGSGEWGLHEGAYTATHSLALFSHHITELLFCI
jgi:hypothetical protein